jgi:hypothetical protein
MRSQLAFNAFSSALAPQEVKRPPSKTIETKLDASFNADLPNTCLVAPLNN